MYLIIYIIRLTSAVLVEIISMLIGLTSSMFVPIFSFVAFGLEVDFPSTSIFFCLDIINHLTWLHFISFLMLLSPLLTVSS